MTNKRALPPYRISLAGVLMAAREAVMAPIRPVLRHADVTEQQWRVLRVLNDEGKMDPSQLASSALLFAPSVTRILKELLDRGLIERTQDPSDGRRSIIVISANGRDLVERAAAHTLHLLDAYAECFGAERLKHLLDEMSALTEQISALNLKNGPIPLIKDGFAPKAPPKRK